MLPFMLAEKLNSNNIVKKFANRSKAIKEFERATTIIKEEINKGTHEPITIIAYTDNYKDLKKALKNWGKSEGLHIVQFSHEGYFRVKVRKWYHAFCIF